MLNPVKEKTEKLLASIDTLATSITDIFNPSTNRDITRSFKDLSSIIANFKATSEKLDKLVGDQNTRLNKIFENVESITKNFRDNNAMLTAAMKNIKNITDSLAASDLKTTVNNAKSAIDQLNQVLEKINKGEGSLGLLVNDKKLYDNLQKSSEDLDKLLVDLKEHPKRYEAFWCLEEKIKHLKRNNNLWWNNCFSESLH
jgi:phospholipid/cholesterol/gamma-HCH transport system substrate-binding protein